MKWRVVLEPDTETGDWAIWCPELPGCVSAGETEQEAMEIGCYCPRFSGASLVIRRYGLLILLQKLRVIK